MTNYEPSAVWVGHQQGLFANFFYTDQTISMPMDFEMALQSLEAMTLSHEQTN